MSQLNSPSLPVSHCSSSLFVLVLQLQTTSNQSQSASAINGAFEFEATSKQNQDPLEVCYPDQQWIDYDGTSYIFMRQQYHTQCVDKKQQPFEYGAFMGYYTTGEPCADACVKGDNTSQLKGCYPKDR